MEYVTRRGQNVTQPPQEKKPLTRRKGIHRKAGRTRHGRREGEEKERLHLSTKGGKKEIEGVLREEKRQHGLPDLERGLVGVGKSQVGFRAGRG